MSENPKLRLKCVAEEDDCSAYLLSWKARAEKTVTVLKAMVLMFGGIQWHMVKVSATCLKDRAAELPVNGEATGAVCLCVCLRVDGSRCWVQASGRISYLPAMFVLICWM